MAASPVRNRLRDKIVAGWDYPRQRWRHRTVRKVLVVLDETRQTITDGLAHLNERTSEILARTDRLREESLRHCDFPPAFLFERDQSLPLLHSSTNIERDYALYQSVRYIIAAGIPGDIVECGVFRGGNTVLAANTLRALGANRRIWLYDTFDDVPYPGESDEWYGGEHLGREGPYLQTASLGEVKANMATTGHDDVVFIKGLVEETIPAQAPEEIALLRLDTDWYESTRHELEHLYPRLSKGGVLIVDDYGHFEGARRAVDDYFHDKPVLLNRIDYSARLVIKS